MSYDSLLPDSDSKNAGAACKRVYTFFVFLCAFSFGACHLSLHFDKKGERLVVKNYCVKMTFLIICIMVRWITLLLSCKAVIILENACR